MRVEIKRLNDKKWYRVKAEELLEKTLLDFIEESETDVIAALFDGDNPVAYVSNNYKYVDLYKEKALSAHAKDLKVLFFGEDMTGQGLPLLAKVFPDSTVQSIEVMK